MNSDFKQAGGFLTLTTPLGEDDLLLDALEGFEGLSELFEFKLFMRSGSTSLNASKIVGKPVTVTLQIQDGPKRYINGIVSRFIQSGGDRDFAHYQAELVPKLWLLNLSRNRKIYQSQTVPEIIKSVLGDFGVTLEDKLSGTYTALEYCVQYDETAFEFISRLMEHAGIFYFFTFANGTHTLVLADASSAHPTCTDAATVRFFPETSLVNAIDTVSRFEHEHSLVLKKTTVSDYDYLNPSTSLEGSFVGADGSGDVYEFPSGHASASEGTALAKIRVQAHQVTAQTLRGQSYVYPFVAGAKFTLKDHFVSTLNVSHVLRRVHHTAKDELYSNAFEAFDFTVPFRPSVRSPRPQALGSETALVVGSSGEEIWTDKYGRIKVQFPWDRDGKKDEKSSIWIRVSQSLAGKGFGALFLPRVGQEVVVTYINGDPQRPLVTGAVYNGENSPPVTLPTNQTQSTFKTRSSKSGTAGNELRFEDKKDAEELYMHAQKDMKIEIENALTTTVKKGAETHTLEEGDRTIDVQKGKEVHKIKGTRLLDVTGNESHANAGDFKHEVTGDYALTIKGSLTINVTGAITLKSSDAVSVSAGTSLTAKSGTDLTNQAGTALTNKAGTELTNKAGTNLTNQAGVQMDNKAAMITSKADAMHTVEAGAMLTLKGAMTKIN